MEKIGIAKAMGIGGAYSHLLCEDCKAKVIEATKSLKKIDMLRPKKVMKKFSRILDDCLNGCKDKVIAEMEKNRGTIR